MKSFCPKCVSVLLSGVILGAAFGLSLCLHGGGQWHLVSSETHGCDGAAEHSFSYGEGHECCTDAGLSFSSEFTCARNIVQLPALFVFSDIVSVSENTVPRPELKISSFKTAPPEVALGSVSQSIVSRLLI